MKRLRFLVRALGLRRGIALRISEMRRAIHPCWGGPFDGEWRFSYDMVWVVYVNQYPVPDGVAPLYSTGPQRMNRTIGLYHWTRAGRYEWTALVPMLVDEEAP